MKKLSGKYSFLVLLLIIICGCNESGNENIPDPVGTVMFELKKDGTTLFQPKDCEGFLYMNKDNNLAIHSGNWEISNLGKKNGLGDITNIPSGTGSYIKSELLPGYGYVVKNISNSASIMTCIFVESYIRTGSSNTGSIIGANIKYYSPFSEKATHIKFVPEKIVLNNNGDRESLAFFKWLSFSVEKSDEWINVSIMSRSIRFTATPNNSPNERSGTIKISSPGLEDVYIEVIQRGKIK